jgi:hypothetical protein
MEVMELEDTYLTNHFYLQEELVEVHLEQVQEEKVVMEQSLQVVEEEALE